MNQILVTSKRSRSGNCSRACRSRSATGSARASRSNTRKRRRRSRIASGACTRCRRYPNGEERCIACARRRRRSPAAQSRSNRVSATTPHAPHDALRHRSARKRNCGFCEARCPVDAIAATRGTSTHMEKAGREHHAVDVLAVGDKYDAMISADKAADAKYRYIGRTPPFARLLARVCGHHARRRPFRSAWRALSIAFFFSGSFFQCRNPVAARGRRGQGLVAKTN